MNLDSSDLQRSLDYVSLRSAGVKARRGTSWSPSSRCASSTKPRTSRRQLLLARLLSGILLVIGVVYATASCLAEYHYSIGFGARPVGPVEALSQLDKAAADFPLNVRFRMGPSVGRSVVAEMNGKPLGLVQDAILSLRHGLVIDYTRADLLAHLIVFEVLGRRSTGRCGLSEATSAGARVPRS